MSWRSIVPPSSGARSPRKVQYPVLDCYTLKEEAVQPSEILFCIQHGITPRRHGNSSAPLCETEISHSVKGPHEHSSYTCEILGFHRNVSKVSVLLGYDTGSLDIWFPVF
jgi:hypothetical protein